MNIEECIEECRVCGLIVMNTRAEVLEAYDELGNGTFIKQAAKYENQNV